jgi:hypothetical protein
MLYFGRVGSSWGHRAFFGSSWEENEITPFIYYFFKKKKKMPDTSELLCKSCENNISQWTMVKSNHFFLKKEKEILFSPLS